MSTVLVDSNVLLDVMTEDADWFAWSSRAIARCAEQSRLVVNQIVFAEISAGFSRMENVEAVLSRATIGRESVPYEAAFLAGKAFAAYRRRGGTKRSPLPDFFIGAHAAVMGYRLVTRDVSRYRTCYPTLSLIAPT